MTTKARSPQVKTPTKASHEVARYWRLSPNTKFVETTLDGKPVPRKRKPTKAPPEANPERGGEA